MKPWQSMFFIERRQRKMDGNYSYFVCSLHTKEIVFPKTRLYGYSTYKDACRGAAQMYNYIEKKLLGE